MTMMKYSVSNFQIFKTNEFNEQPDLFKNFLPLKDKTQENNKKFKIKISEPSLSNDRLSEEDDKELFNSRIERFLSVCELPEDVALLAHQRLERPDTIHEEDEEVPEIQRPKTKSSSKSRKTPKQIEKANIIADIIRNFDMDKYLKDFKLNESAVIKLSERYKFLKNELMNNEALDFWVTLY